MLQIFTQGLAEQGHVEGRDYVLIRSGVFYGPNEHEAIARVLEAKPDLILATNLGYVVALRKVTTTIPIVMWVSGFPVERGGGGTRDTDAWGCNPSGAERARARCHEMASSTGNIKLTIRFANGRCRAPALRRVTTHAAARSELDEAFCRSRGAPAQG
jgi:hypothetical protein